MKVIVDSKYYEYNHEKKPRGDGYWAFIFSKGALTMRQIGERQNNCRWYPEMNSNLPGIPYSEAKKRATEDAAKLGFGYAYALS